MPVFNRIKIFWQEGVALPQLEFVAWAVQYMLDFIGHGQEIKIEHGHGYILDGYKGVDPDLMSFDWVYADGLSNVLLKKQLEEKEDFFFLVAVSDPMFYVEDGVCKLAIGWGKQDSGCLVNVGKLSYLNTPGFGEKLLSIIMHELGHVFGVGHCADITCAMYPFGNSKNIDFVKKPFCKDCLSKLLEYFKQSDSTT